MNEHEMLTSKLIITKSALPLIALLILNIAQKTRPALCISRHPNFNCTFNVGVIYIYKWSSEIFTSPKRTHSENFISDGSHHIIPHYCIDFLRTSTSLLNNSLVA